MSRALKIISGLLLVGLAGWGAFLTTQSLDRADKWSSVVGLFVSTALAFAGVVMGWIGLRASGRPNSPGAQSNGAGSQVITDSTIGGDNINVGRARDVNIHRRG